MTKEYMTKGKLLLSHIQNINFTDTKKKTLEEKWYRQVPISAKSKT